MKMAHTLALPIPQPPPSRGKLLDAAAVRAMFAVDRPPSIDWIYLHVPHKVKVGRRSYWWSDDVLAWLESLRDHEAA